MKYGLQVIHNNSRDHTSWIAFLTKNKSYIFSCGDGIQRMLSLYVKLVKVDTVFIPSNNWDYMWGFPGLFMTAKDSIHDVNLSDFKINVHGPSNFNDVLREARYFMNRLSYIGVHQYGVKSQNDNKNRYEAKPNGMRYWTTTDYMESDELNVDVIQNFDINMKNEMLSYVWIPPLQKGKFLAEKAIKLGCKPGIDFK